MFCTNCGTQSTPGQRFCTTCGSPLAAAPAAPGGYAPAAGFAPAAAPGVVAHGAQPYPGNVWTNAAQHKQGVLNSVTAKLNRLASTEKLEGFSLREMFSEVFKRRSETEIEDYMIVGTTRTTPDITEVQTGWPHPWLFARVLGVLLLTYAAFWVAWNQFNNPNLIPGLMLLGSFAVPLTMIILFFELNTPRNVSVHRLAVLFLAGAAISLFVSLIGYGVSDSTLGLLGAVQPGVIEETGKILTVVLIARSMRYKYILNGLLVGATVGAGFAAFESAGYAFRSPNVAAMLQEIQLRAIDTPFLHVAWTAIAAGALWRAKGEKPFTLKVLFDPTFLKAFSIPVVLHIFWDSSLAPHLIKQVIVYPLDYFIIFGMVQQGLRQVREDQKAKLAETVSLLHGGEAAAAAAATS